MSQYSKIGWRDLRINGFFRGWLKYLYLATSVASATVMVEEAWHRFHASMAGEWAYWLRSIFTYVDTDIHWRTQDFALLWSFYIVTYNVQWHYKSFMVLMILVSPFVLASKDGFESGKMTSSVKVITCLVKWTERAFLIAVH